LEKYWFLILVWLGAGSGTGGELMRCSVWDGDVASVGGGLSVFLATYREMLMGCVNMVSLSDSSVLFMDISRFTAVINVCKSSIMGLSMCH
jgi:hypothetical protein